METPSTVFFQQVFFALSISKVTFNFPVPIVHIINNLACITQNEITNSSIVSYP